MDDLSRALSDDELAALRAAYDPNALLASKVDATSDAHTPLARWTQVIGETFYRQSPLAARERELCLVAILAAREPGLSLATHVYAALMEGATLAEVCHVTALAGCYCGLPAYTQSAATMHKTLQVLKRLVHAGTCDHRAVFISLVKELAGVAL